MSPAAKARGAERGRHAAEACTPPDVLPPGRSRGRSIGRSQGAFQGSGRMRTEGGDFQLRALAQRVNVGAAEIRIAGSKRVPSANPRCHLWRKDSWSWRAEFCTDEHSKRFERDFAASALGDFEVAGCPRLGEYLEKPCKSMKPFFPKRLLTFLFLLASPTSLGTPSPQTPVVIASETRSERRS
jgi:hypothetical protein